MKELILTNTLQRRQKRKMPNKRWQYILTLRTQNLRKARGLSNVCYRCGVDVTLGAEIYSRNTNGRKSKSKIYHKECAEEVNII